METDEERIQGIERKNTALGEIARRQSNLHRLVAQAWERLKSGPNGGELSLGGYRLVKRRNIIIALPSEFSEGQHPVVVYPNPKHFDVYAASRTRSPKSVYWGDINPKAVGTIFAFRYPPPEIPYSSKHGDLKLFISDIQAHSKTNGENPLPRKRAREHQGWDVAGLQEIFKAALRQGLFPLKILGDTFEEHPKYGLRHGIAKLCKRSGLVSFPGHNKSIIIDKVNHGIDYTGV
ncbi:MAG: hypothetical protein AABX01_04340 [Candidatus Micrarchaeota archaeon]